jgi:hypothetical protein
VHNSVHKKLVDAVVELDKLPDGPEFAEWIKAGAHLAFLQQNAVSDEVVVFASGEYTYLHSVVVPNRKLLPACQPR